MAAPGGYPAAAPGDGKPGRSIQDRENPLLVLKVGTSSLMTMDESGQRVQLGNIANLVELISQLRRKGFQVVLVSSGAVGMGCIKLGLKAKPKDLRTKQAVAAAGQSHLMRLYEDLFLTVRLQAAQLLISQSDFMEKDHWANIRNTIHECLKLGLVPVINENDVTNTAELRFGDNDNLAALTAVQLEADGLFLFTDVDFLYTSNPRTDPDAKELRVVKEAWALQVDTRLPGSALGTGGMSTKIVAARTASAAGIACGLINGAYCDRLHSFLGYFVGAGDDVPLPHGTYFAAMPQTQNVGDVRRWIISLPISGDLVVDDGAARALANKKSLLPAGIIKVTGRFLSNEAVRIVHQDNEIARAMVNLPSEELAKVCGKHSHEFEDVLGYACDAEACHRDNVILTAAAESLKKFDVVSKLRQAPQAPLPASPIKRSGSFS